jgi:putative membrane protein
MLRRHWSFLSANHYLYMSARRYWTLVGLVLLVGISFIGSPFHAQLPLQHVPTAIALALFLVLSRRYPLSTASFVCLAGFLLVHTLGARYVYSNVPYDEWSVSIFGKSISETFGWTRNHYDRLVHFSYGVFFFIPAREVLIRYMSIPQKRADYFALEFVMASSMVYEFIEWGLGAVLAPEIADAYNGQQGDLWDSHKDMALATAGGLLTLIVLRILISRKSRKRNLLVPKQTGKKIV